MAVANPARAAPSVALVHDYLTQRGGAERVVLAMAAAFPGAPLYTSLYEPEDTYHEFAEIDVRAGPVDRLAVLRRHHRLALPLLAPSFSRTDVHADVVLCSSSGWAHGVRAHGRKIVYCHSPAKWLYAPARYFSGGWPSSRIVLTALRPRLERWDRRAARSAHRYLVNSTMVQQWVQDLYGLEADVLPPPLSVDVTGPREPVPGIEPGFLLVVSRLLPYKNVDAVVHAFRELPEQQLVVVGSGPSEAALRAFAGSNVTFLGRVQDPQLRWLYSSCLGLVAASLEDFGLTPLEAATFGKPAAVLRWGGFLDTVREGETGVFFEQPAPVAVAQALRELVETTWSEDLLRAHADSFSVERFQNALHDVVLAEVERA